MKNWTLVFITTITTGLSANAANQDSGLLPELSQSLASGEQGEQATRESEALIAKAELKAIESLQSLIQKKKGSPTEADLWLRLAELYLRRAKSGRYLDLQQKNQKSSMAQEQLIQAQKIFSKMVVQFPKFSSLDLVYFNWAFTCRQLGQNKKAEELYSEVSSRFTQSAVRPDALMALAEMKYDRQDFSGALVELKKIESYPAAQVYGYSLYKQAWSLYNLKRNHEATEKLIAVTQLEGSHRLRPEALRDLTLFFSEAQPPESAYSFFKKITSTEELAEAIYNLSSLYSSHSRFDDLYKAALPYLSDVPMSSAVVKLQTLILNSYETQKKRTEVLVWMKKAAANCSPNSDWRNQNPTIAEAQCESTLAKSHLEITKKWWDLWLKNKSNSSIADLTAEAFQIHLSRENPKQIDAKSHYAYAELLYQRSYFRPASEQYLITSQNTQDKELAHDSAYSALASLESAMQVKSETVDILKQSELCKSYLERFKDGKYREQVLFKFGFIAYQNKDFDESLKILSPLADKAKTDLSLQVRSQDLVLDIYNSQTDLDQLISKANNYVTKETSPDRIKKLNQIRREAEFARIQKNKIEDAPMVTFEKLKSFAEMHKEDADLSEKATLQAIALAYATDHKISGAEMAMKLEIKSEKQKDKIDMLKEATRTFYGQGFFEQALTALDKLKTIQSGKERQSTLTLISNIAKLNQNIALEQKLLRDQISSSKDKVEVSNLYRELLQSSLQKNSSLKSEQIKNEIRNKKIEPLVYELELESLSENLANGKRNEVFEKAKKFVGLSEYHEIRAFARLLQAQVLEYEFNTQSTKTELDRMVTVISLKTEKLEKAQSAYLAAASYSNTEKINILVSQGLHRLYTTYAKQIRQVQIKGILSEDEKNALNKELETLASPIQKKAEDLEKKLAKLGSSPDRQTNQVDWLNLDTQVPTPYTGASLQVSRFEDYTPEMSRSGDFSYRQIEKKNKLNCSEKNNFAKMNLSELILNTQNCLFKDNEEAFLSGVRQMAEAHPTSGLAPYHLSLWAKKQNQLEKSLALLDLALTLSAETTFFSYQKAVVLAGLKKERSEIEPLLLKAFDSGLELAELKIFHADLQFQKGDCLTAIEDLKSTKSDLKANYEMQNLEAECLAISGETQKSLQILKDQNNFSRFLEQARIQEKYLQDNNAAKLSLMKARDQKPNENILKWINEKINWLENQHVIQKTAQGGT